MAVVLTLFLSPAAMVIGLALGFLLRNKQGILVILIGAAAAAIVTAVMAFLLGYPPEIGIAVAFYTAAFWTGIRASGPYGWSGVLKPDWWWR